MQEAEQTVPGGLFVTLPFPLTETLSELVGAVTVTLALLVLAKPLLAAVTLSG